MAQGFCIDRTTGAAAIAIALAPGYQWTLHGIRLHLDIVGGAVENLTVTVDGGYVALVYDTLLLTQAMAAVTDLVWTPDAPIHLGRDDVLDIAYANTNNRTYGVEIIFSMEE